MKLNVIGAIRRKGISKKTGNSYDFAVLKALSPIKTSSSESMTVTGSGYQETEYPLEVGVESQFADVKFPALVECVVDVRPDDYGNVVAVVTGRA